MTNIATKEISLHSIDLSNHSERDFEFDETISDHLPNIKEVLCVDSAIVKKELLYDNDKLNAEITVKYKLFYSSDINNNLCVYSFLRKTTIKTDEKKSDDVYYFISTQLSSPSFRTLNPRKIFIKSKISFDILKAQQHMHNTISDIQQGCCVKTVSIAPSTITELCSESIAFEDVLTLGDGYDPIDSILDISASVANHELELVPGYINIKGNISFSIIYSSEIDNEKTVRVERQLFFEKSIPCANNDDAYECIGKIAIEEIDATPQIDTYGEYRTLNIKYSLEADIIGIMNSFDAIVNDIFSPGMIENITTDNITYSILHPKQEKLLTFEGMISTDEASFNRIISSRANIFISSRTGDELKGNIDIYVIGETSEGLQCFMSKKEFSESISDIPSFLDVEIIECNVSISGSNDLAYKVIGKVSSLSFENKTIEIIKNVEFSEITNDKDNLIIYYPSPNEAIWDISKRYHVTPESIKASNPLIAGEKVTNNEILIIKK